MCFKPGVECAQDGGAMAMKRSRRLVGGLHTLAKLASLSAEVSVKNFDLWCEEATADGTTDETKSLQAFFDLGESFSNWPSFATSRLISHEDAEHLVAALTQRRSRQQQPQSCLSTSSIPSRVSFLSSAFGFPRMDKLELADACFYDDEAGNLAIFDGVGEWEEYGISAKGFSEELSNLTQEAGRGFKELGRSQSLSPSAVALQMMKKGYASTTAVGSSTALTVSLDSASATVGVACLGDCKVLLLRRNVHTGVYERVLETQEQQHWFNCPFQLTRLPSEQQVKEMKMRGGRQGAFVAALKMQQQRAQRVKEGEDGEKQEQQGGGEGVVQDTPEKACLYEVKVQEGDLVILGTDGLFDNLFTHEIEALASHTLSPAEALEIAEPFVREPIRSAWSGKYTKASALARALAEAALHRSQDPDTDTPFAQRARECGIGFHGGKADDITCTASWVVSDLTKLRLAALKKAQKAHRKQQQQQSTMCGLSARRAAGCVCGDDTTVSASDALSPDVDAVPDPLPCLHDSARLDSASVSGEVSTSLHEDLVSTLASASSYNAAESPEGQRRSHTAPVAMRCPLKTVVVVPQPPQLSDDEEEGYISLSPQHSSINRPPRLSAFASPNAKGPMVRETSDGVTTRIGMGSLSEAETAEAAELFSEDAGSVGPEADHPEAVHGFTLERERGSLWGDKDTHPLSHLSQCDGVVVEGDGSPLPLLQFPIDLDFSCTGLEEAEAGGCVIDDDGAPILWA